MYWPTAFDCECNHMIAPCWKCEAWCERCDGTGVDTSEIFLSVTVFGITSVFVGEVLDCPDCDGNGYVE